MGGQRVTLSLAQPRWRRPAFFSATERVFSILTASFNEQQDCALVDYIQASVIAQYNKRYVLATAYSILKRKRFMSKNLDRIVLV